MINETLSEAGQKMDKAVEVAREDFAAIRTGRAHPSMFAKITADYYGSPSRSNSSLRSPSQRRGWSSSRRTTWAR